jgi:hypothetical protein
MTVEPGKVREFSRATAAGRASRADPAGPVPPTFLASSVFWAPPESSALALDEQDTSRILHRELEYRFYGAPIAAGETLTVQERVDDVYVKQGRGGGEMTFTLYITEYRRPDGELAAEARQTIIVTGQAAG